MDSNYGVIEFIKAPILDKATKKALVEFKQKYDAYKDKCADVNIYVTKQTSVMGLVNAIVWTEKFYWLS